MPFIKYVEKIASNSDSEKRGQLHFLSLNANSFCNSLSLHIHSIFLRHRDYLMICLSFPLESKLWDPSGWGFDVINP